MKISDKVPQSENVFIPGVLRVLRKMESFFLANLGVIVPIFDGTDGGLAQTKSQPKRGFSAVKMDGRWKGQWLLFFGVANLVRDIEMAMRWFSTKQIGPATSTHELL